LSALDVAGLGCGDACTGFELSTAEPGSVCIANVGPDGLGLGIKKNASATTAANPSKYDHIADIFFRPEIAGAEAVLVV